MIFCPECGMEVRLPDDVTKEELFECGNCGVELVVVSTDPPRVELYEEEEK
ncbi:MAG: lysine biosynthesis protein LysW [Deltaproteobacteria bacterium]|nr:MAG: lysine biosynthesis protein LysW [Deltaproteobacteria bacterium]